MLRKSRSSTGKSDREAHSDSDGPSRQSTSPILVLSPASPSAGFNEIRPESDRMEKEACGCKDDHMENIRPTQTVHGIAKQKLQHEVRKSLKAEIGSGSYKPVKRW